MKTKLAFSISILVFSAVAGNVIISSHYHTQPKSFDGATSIAMKLFTNGWDSITIKIDRDYWTSNVTYTVEGLRREMSKNE